MSDLMNLLCIFCSSTAPEWRWWCLLQFFQMVVWRRWWRKISYYCEPKHEDRRSRECS